VPINFPKDILKAKDPIGTGTVEAALVAHASGKAHRRNMYRRENGGEKSGRFGPLSNHDPGVAQLHLKPVPQLTPNG
jgi:hypothetical protein